jgi:hypothetical protein
MKAKFLIKQKGTNKIKDYPQTRSLITKTAIQNFGLDTKDISQSKLANCTILHRVADLPNEIQKLTKKVKTGIYLFEQIQTNTQSLCLLIRFSETTAVNTQSGFQNYLFPDNKTLIYVYTQNR